ncbi:FKBP-type peptidyl-prolyl cis-trans isomerase [Flavicella sp.]|uniref:FKBP-type peptidyl-prolyl cis-trans isomerase n=1 Tax=Flavicella sp. TaxID=2957742 RepID=UPI0030183B19
MKKLSILFALLFVLSSCSDDDDDFKDYSEENELEIIDYIAQNELEATRTSSGLYYVIDVEGEGEQPTATSDVSIKYKGTLIDGTVFNDTEGEIVSFNLETTILGFTEGMQYFKEGGSGILLIPAHLAYGSTGTAYVPGGSVLIFEIELIDYEKENDQEIVAYLEENGITGAIKTESGLYYLIDVEGTGETPTIDSEVTVAYIGAFTDGDVFDESSVSGSTFYLDEVIEGWGEGIQYFKEGGSGKLFVPSHLGYGIYDYSTIPGGSVLVFDIDLKSINVSEISK